MPLPDFDRGALAWRAIDERVIFLDVAADRYFRLSDKENHAFLAAIARGERLGWRQPPEFARPNHWLPPAKTAPAVLEGSFNLAETARALWLQRRVERRLAATGLHAVLTDFQRLLATGATRSSSNEARTDRVVRAFEHARLLRSAASRCLTRSLALSTGLAAQGTQVSVVIGVKLAPFAAHCWAQCGDAVISDSVDEVQCYAPLLVL